MTCMHIPAGTLIDGRFRIGKLLGAGGMGVVYEAEQIELNRVVAIKFLSDSGVDESEDFARFRQEAQVLSQLQHKNIISVYAFGRWQNSAYMVMERVEGNSLQDMLRDNKPLDSEFVLNVGMQVCAGLEAAHASGVVHRDLKPSNLIVAKSGEIKIIDFGLAKLLSWSSKRRQQLTEAGSAVGSVLYMSPEQALGGVVDARSDIYSLGCVMHHCLAGVSPFTGDHSVVVMMAHAKDMPPPLPDAAGNLAVVVRNAMAKNAGDRYQSAAEMRADLEQVAKGGSVIESCANAPVLAVVEAMPARHGRFRVLAVVAVLAAISAVALWKFYLSDAASNGTSKAHSSELTLSEFIIAYDNAHLMLIRHNDADGVSMLRKILKRAPAGDLSSPWSDHLKHAIWDLLDADIRFDDPQDAEMCTQIALRFPVHSREQVFALRDISMRLTRMRLAKENKQICERLRKRILEGPVAGASDYDMAILIAHVARVIEDKDKAEPLFATARKLALKCGEPDAIVTAIGSSINHGFAVDDDVREGLAILGTKPGPASAIADALLKMGYARTLSTQGRSKEALQLLGSINDLPPREKAQLQHMKATIYIDQHDPRNGARCEAEAIRVIEANPGKCDPVVAIQAYILAALCARSNRDLPAASRYMQLAEDYYYAHRKETSYNPLAHINYYRKTWKL